MTMTDKSIPGMKAEKNLAAGALSGGNDLLVDRTTEQLAQPAPTPPAQPPHQIT